MKLAIIASLISAASAFSTQSSVKSSLITLNAAEVEAPKPEEVEMSDAIPYLPRPQNLKGYIGDVGFDPLRISDYFPMDYLREAEIKHGRICMLAWTGFCAVDRGFNIYPLPAEWEGLTSRTAHNALVDYGSMGNMAVFLGIAEIVSWLAVSEMLQGSGRAPGDFGFDPLGILQDKSEDEVNRWKLRELKHGRLAMLAFSGVVTQSVAFDLGYPYWNF